MELDFLSSGMKVLVSWYLAWNNLYTKLYCITDHYPDWFIKNSTIASFGSGCQKAGLLLRIWCCCALSSNVSVCSYCSLAGLYLVCYWQHRATRSHSSWLAWYACWRHKPTIQRLKLVKRPKSTIKIRHSTLFYPEQPYQCWVWKRLTEYECRKNIQHLCDVGWM